MPDTRRAAIALFLLGLSVLALEISLTRILSVMSWHHFAYLIISLALLGFGAASSFLTVSPRFAGADFDDSVIARYAFFYCVATVFSFATMTKILFYPLDAYVHRDYSQVYSLLLLYLVVGVPFFFAGTCIGYLLSRAGEAVNRLYFADLLGAGSGALLAILGINQLGAESTIYAVAAAGGIVAWLFAAPRSWLRGAALAAVAVCGFLTIVATRGEIFPVYFPPEKLFREALVPHYHRWHVIARVDVLEPESRWWSFGGALSRTFEGEFPPVRGVYQDGAAPTGIMNVTPGQDIRSIPILDYYLQRAPYLVKSGAPRALVIGVGGGIDVLMALHAGIQHVTGAELNPLMVEAVKHRFADFAGHVFERPEVELIHTEGRHYLSARRTEADRQNFDVIQLSGVDIYNAASAGAYALSENFLYTAEAMNEIWDNLTDTGIASFSRFLFEPDRETIRVAATMLETLDAHGVAEPGKHVMVISAPMYKGDKLSQWGEAMLKKDGFSEAEVATYREWAKRMDFRVLYDPYEPRENEFDRLIRTTPAERAAFMRDYQFRIEPVTDDSPFFFQFYRWGSLLRPTAQGTGGVGMERVPLGIAVLLISFLQILVLASACIIGPLLPRGGQLRAVPHKLSLLFYFAALGVGFISIEVAMLQKLTIFLGGPVYAMAITLFAVLACSGLGSLLAQRIRRPLPAALSRIIAALAVMVVLEAAFLRYGLPRLMFLSHTARCVVAVLAIAPIAVLMGMPFPTGLRVAQRLHPAIVPWAWGVNALMTTLGTMVCVLLSMEAGFTVTLLSAAVLYVAGLAAMLPAARAVSSA